jgi:protein TonB
MNPGPAAIRNGPLWAAARRADDDGFDLRRAVFYAFWVEAAVIAGLLSLNFTTSPGEPRKPTIMRHITADAAPPPASRREPPLVRHDIRHSTESHQPTPAPTPSPIDDFHPGQTAGPEVAEIPRFAGGPEDAPATSPTSALPTVRRGIAPVFRVEPAYPRAAHRAGVEGGVVAHLHIRADGTVQRVDIVQSIPRGVFDREAVAALLQWRFAPEEVGFLGEVEIVFKLAPD